MKHKKELVLGCSSGIFLATSKGWSKGKGKTNVLVQGAGARDLTSLVLDGHLPFTLHCGSSDVSSCSHPAVIAFCP